RRRRGCDDRSIETAAAARRLGRAQSAAQRRAAGGAGGDRRSSSAEADLCLLRSEQPRARPGAAGGLGLSSGAGAALRHVPANRTGGKRRGFEPSEKLNLLRRLVSLRAKGYNCAITQGAWHDGPGRKPGVSDRWTERAAGRGSA